MRHSTSPYTAVSRFNSQAWRAFTSAASRRRPDLETAEGHSLSAEAPPFEFKTGVAFFAKRDPRPFPPPFLSPPSASFSKSLSTHDRSLDRRPCVNGQLIRGYTNGDDAAYADKYFIGVNDGVGAWSTRPGGHAGLWSRLILHFWAVQVESEASRVRPPGQFYQPTPIEYLQEAFEQTRLSTATPNEWQGTTTAVGAQLHFHTSTSDPSSPATPLLYVTNLGDSKVVVIRPREKRLIYKTIAQWHWFDCPRQLGTNSPDTPRENAVMDTVEIEEDDVVLAMSDGVADNLWEHEIVANVTESVQKWQAGEIEHVPDNSKAGAGKAMDYVAEELMTAAKIIAEDPFAESPFMEHAVEEGLAMEGGKLDDISVVAALCKRSNG
ncbi:MAG: hypothetical protein M1818_008096 [Claussenomyces sp. TS43310]|nr:MAG: hypothetical protein M1818_008096 [Claussenomyces sp. TS43310]